MNARFKKYWLVPLMIAAAGTIAIFIMGILVTVFGFSISLLTAPV